MRLNTRAPAWLVGTIGRDSDQIRTCIKSHKKQEEENLRHAGRPIVSQYGLLKESAPGHSIWAQWLI